MINNKNYRYIKKYNKIYYRILGCLRKIIYYNFWNNLASIVTICGILYTIFLTEIPNKLAESLNV